MDSELRNCGSCQECCTFLAIPELNKAENEPCKHLSDDGCSIYQDRPDVCQGFNCLWKFRNLFVDKKGKRRPDRLGVMVRLRNDIEGIRSAIQFIGKNKDIFKTEKVRTLRKNLLSAGFTIVQTIAGETKSKMIRPRN